MTDNERRHEERMYRGAAILLAGMLANPNADTTAKGQLELANQALTLYVHLSADIADLQYKVWDKTKKWEAKNADSK